MLNTNIEKNFSAIILAAGKSSRMGIPKWSLQFDQNRSFIENIVNEYYKFGCKEISIVINETDYSSFIERKYKLYENVNVVINGQPDWHRFYSLKLAAKSLSKTQSVFIHNVDNPFVNHQVLAELLNNVESINYIIPEFEGKGGHPILLSQKIISDVVNETENQLHFKDFLNRYSKKKLPVFDEKILININSINEYQQYFTS